MLLPGPEVSRVRVSIIQGQEVIFFFYGEWQEHELDSTSFLPDDDPGAVRPVGVAIGKAWRFYTAISAFQCAATCVDETWRREKRFILTFDLILRLRNKMVAINSCCVVDKRIDRLTKGKERERNYIWSLKYTKQQHWQWNNIVCVSLCDTGIIWVHSCSY